MKKSKIIITTLIVSLCVALFGTFCIWFIKYLTQNVSYSYDTATHEKEHLYYKDVDVIVLDCDYNHWYASAHHYTADVTVYSEEYGLTKTFHYTANDAQQFENCQTGQICTATMYSWKIDSTGEITRRELSSIKY